MSENFANEYYTTLSADAAGADTVIAVVSVTGAPSVPFRIKINDEYMLVRGISGTNLTVERALEGSGAVDHFTGDDVTHVLTAEGLLNVRNYSRSLYLYDECAFRTATALLNDGFTQAVSGTSAASFGGSGELQTHPGIIGLSTGTTSAGRATMQASHVFYVGFGRMRFGIISRLGANPSTNLLSDNTNQYQVNMGWGTSTVALPTSGIFFRYTHSVNSGKWEAVTHHTGGTTATDTGVTADLNWHRFEIDIDPAGTEVRFFIDGVRVATNTTNIVPNNAGLFPYPMGIYKSIGTSARHCLMDAFWYQLDFTTPR